MKKACILLENGFYQQGLLLGAEGETIGEIVFNTSMSGYQEILTDPSYKGQIVCMTYPLIGNYGVNGEDIESKGVHAEGFIVKEKSRIVSNWRAGKSLEDYLKENNVTGIEGVDTRAITRHLRITGSMKGVISSSDFDKDSLASKLKNFPSIIGRDLVREVSGNQAYDWEESLPAASSLPPAPYTIAVIDCGVKYSILRHLKAQFKEVKVVPANSSLDTVLKLNPQGILFSNGPGDPQAVSYAVNLAKEILVSLEGNKLKASVLGICLGHQILGLALGAKTYKLKFGHHGGNHPVKDLRTGRIDITAQNHNFCVDTQSLPKTVEQTHINLYDNTPEGTAHKTLPVFSVQFHPEAGPGPFDAGHIFGEFRRMVEKNL